jgi:predicted outer membrane repeat protein
MYKTWTHLALLACIYLLSTPLTAQIFVNASATGADDGSSWSDAYTDLQSALEQASPGDEIWVAAGVYNPGVDTTASFNVPEGVRLLGGFSGTETSVSERDVTTHETILSGDVNGDDMPGFFEENRTDNNLHVIRLDTNVTIATLIDGFTISGGDAVFDGGASIEVGAGGGILSFGAPTINQCIIKDNSAGSGGGITAWLGNASGMRVTNSQVIQNRGIFGGGAIMGGLASGLWENCTIGENFSVSSGGGIYHLNSLDSFINCTFIDNNAGVTGTGPAGGAFLSDGDIHIMIACTFDNNFSSSAGGAIFKFDDHVESLIRNCEFINNTCENGSGAMEIQGGFNILAGCRFFGSEGTFGGAIGVQGDGTEAQFSNCSFENNESSNSGGALSATFEPTVSIINSMFFENRSGESGGAIYTQEDSTLLAIIGTSFRENQADNSGGALFLRTGTIASIDSSIFETNVSALGTDNGSGGAILFLGDSAAVSRLDLTRTTFIGNIASDQGGAITNSDSEVNITNCIFAYNSSQARGNGGAIINNGSSAFGSPMRLVNNTFAFNEGDFAPHIAQWTSPDDPSHTASMELQNNIFSEKIGSAGAYVVEDGNPIVVSSGGNVFEDGSLGSNALPTDQLNVIDVMFADEFTFDLERSSPAINAGINFGAPTLDIYGFERLGIGKDTVDAGAVEFDLTPSENAWEVISTGMKVFPTVSLDDVTIVFEPESADPVDLSIIDQLGRVVDQKKVEQVAGHFRWTYSTAHLPPGQYFVQALSGKEIRNARFIKAR